MRAKLRKWWEARPPRDRLVLAVLAWLVGVAVYVGLVQSASRARAQLATSVSALRAQASRLEQDAAELARVRAVRVPQTAQADLRTLLQSQVTTAGLAGGLLRIEATGADRAQVVFGSVPFSDWLDWVTALQAQRIRLEAGRIEALSTPGLVGVNATFARAHAQ